MQKINGAVIMVRLQITSDKNNIISVIQEAILAKMKRTEIGFRKTEQQIRKFETKYHISSAQFLSSYTAEDLTGGDDDYICWLGEIKLREALIEELQALNEIEYIPQRLSA
jgi:hypothetical protein